MAGTLLVLGVTLFLLGTVLLARDAASRGRSALVMVLPFAGADHVRTYWRELWWLVSIRIIGACLVAAGVAVIIARDPLVLKEPRRIAGKPVAAVVEGSEVAEMNSFANSEEAILRAIRLDKDPNLSGRINGKDFSYDRVQVSEGVITIQQGEGFLADLEVRVIMAVDPEQIKRRQEWYVQPGDPDPPEIHLSELAQGETLPVTRIISSGYRMDLQLARLDRNQLTGFVQLILPDAQRSFLSGEFTAFTNNLRYVGDRVDVTYDHTDTLEFLATEYLDTQFPENMLVDVQFHDSELKSSSGTGTTVARLTLRNGRVEERMLRFERSEVGWAVMHGSKNITVIEEGGQGLRMRTVIPGTERDDKQGPVEPLEPITIAFADLGELAGQIVVLRRTDGKTEQGAVVGVSRGKLQLERMVGNGMVQFSVQEQDIAGMQLATGREVLFAESGEDGDQAAPAVPAPVTETSDEGAGEQQAATTQASGAVISEDIRALKPYQGKQVEITDTDGKVRAGLVTEVSNTRLQLTVRVGSGQLDYYYTPADIERIREVGSQ